MRLVPAFGVIAENLDHATVADPAVATFCDHTFQFQLESGKLFEPPVNFL